MTPINADWVRRIKLNLLVPHYLMASYLYYHCDLSLMTDDGYDLCCNRLYKFWSVIKHRHKSLISRSALTATTGYHIKRRDIPTIVQVAAHSLYSLIENDQTYESICASFVPPHDKPANVPLSNEYGGSSIRPAVVRRRSVAPSGTNPEKSIQRGASALQPPAEVRNTPIVRRTTRVAVSANEALAPSVDTNASRPVLRRQRVLSGSTPVKNVQCCIPEIQLPDTWEPRRVVARIRRSST